MSYSPKYKTRAADLSGFRYRVLIEQDGWGGGVTDVAPSDGFYDEAIGQKGTEGLSDQPIQVSSVRFAVDASPGLLTELFDAPDREYRVKVERQRFEDGEALGSYENHWRGFLVTDFYEDQPYEDRSRIELEAIDGLALLKNEPYEPPEREENIWDAFERILHGLYYLRKPAGKAADLRVHQQWEPGGSDYDVPEPTWKNLTTQKANWDVSDKDKDPVWASQWDLLTQALAAFGCTLRQSGFRWVVRQRSGAQETGDVVYQREVENPDYAPIRSSPINRRDVSGWKFERHARRSFLQRATQSRSTYEFEREGLSKLVSNGSFEEEVQDWELLPSEHSDVFRKRYSDQDGAPSEAQEQKWFVFIDYGDKDNYEAQLRQSALSVIYGGAAQELNVDISAGTSVADTDGSHLFTRVSVGGFFLDHSAVELRERAVRSEGDDGKLYIEPIPGSKTGAVLVPAGTTLNIRTDANRASIPDNPPVSNNRASTITLAKPLRVGDSVVVGRISDSAGGDYYYLAYPHWSKSAAKTRLGGTHNDFQFTSALSRTASLQTPDGTRVVGEVSVEVGKYEGTDSFEAYVDDVAISVTEQGEPVNQVTTLAFLARGNATESAVTVGDGPTAEANSRIRAQDADGTWHNLTSGWGVGGGTLSLSELRARESLRQRREQVEVRTVTFQLRDGQDIHSHEIIEWDGALWDIGYMRRQAGGRNIGRVTVELRKLEDFGTSGIEYQYAQASEPTSPGTVNVIAGGTNDSGTGGSGTLDWSNVVDKPSLTNTFEGRSGDVTLLSSDVTGALGYDPQSEFLDEMEVTGTAGEVVTAPDGAGGVQVGLPDAVDVQASLTLGGNALLQDEGPGVLGVFDGAGTNHAELVVNDLTVKGTVNQKNTNELQVKDQYISAAADQTGTPSLNAGMYVERGDGSDAYLEWDEGLDRWGSRLEGGSFGRFLQDGDSPTFGTVTLANLEASDLTSNGEILFDQSAGLYLNYDSNAAPSSKGPASIMDARNTIAGANIRVTGGTSKNSRATVKVEPQGSGSGLNADMLDGHDGDYFAALSEDEFITGNWTHSNTLSAPGLEGTDKPSEQRLDFGLDTTLEGERQLRYRVNEDGSRSAPASYHAFFAGGSEVVRFEQSGRVGIGTASPSGALDVAGEGLLDALTHDGGTGTRVASDHWTDKQTGYAIGYEGRLDARQIYTDELIAKTFTVDLTQALAGSDFLTKSVATLASSFTVPAQGETATLHLNDLPGQKGVRAFEAGDWIRLRVVDNSGGGLTVVDAWGTVSSYVDQGDGTQEWTFAREDADAAADGAVVESEAPALDYGQAGQGIIRRTVEGGTYGAVETWASDPIDGSNYDTHFFYGDLTQIAAAEVSSSEDHWGLYTNKGRFESDILVGSLDKSGSYLEYTESGGLELRFLKSGGGYETLSAFRQEVDHLDAEVLDAEEVTHDDSSSFAYFDAQMEASYAYRVTSMTDGFPDSETVALYWHDGSDWQFEVLLENNHPTEGHPKLQTNANGRPTLKLGDQPNPPYTSTVTLERASNKEAFRAGLRATNELRADITGDKYSSVASFRQTVNDQDASITNIKNELEWDDANRALAKIRSSVTENESSILNRVLYNDTDGFYKLEADDTKSTFTVSADAVDITTDDLTITGGDVDFTAGSYTIDADHLDISGDDIYIAGGDIDFSAGSYTIDAPHIDLGGVLSVNATGNSTQIDADTNIAGWTFTSDRLLLNSESGNSLSSGATVETGKLYNNGYGFQAEGGNGSTATLNVHDAPRSYGGGVEMGVADAANDNYVSIANRGQRSTMGITVHSQGEDVLKSSASGQALWVGGDTLIDGEVSIGGLGSGRNVLTGGHPPKTTDATDYAFWGETFFSRLYFDYESGLNGWQDTSSAGIGRSSTSYRGGYSLFIENTSDGGIETVYELDAEDQIQRLTFHYRETGSSNGGGMRLLNAEGDQVMGAVTTNPGWAVIDSGGKGEFYSNSSYQEWHRVEIDFDWDAGIAEVNWQNVESGDRAAYTAGLENTGSGVSKMQIQSYAGGWNTGGNELVYWLDEVEVIRSGDQNNGIEAGDTVAISAEGRVPSGSGSGEVEVQTLRADPTGSRSSRDALDFTQPDWNREATTFTVPSDATYARVRATDPDDLKGAQIRRVQVEKGMHATKYTPGLGARSTTKIDGANVVTGFIGDGLTKSASTNWLDLNPEDGRQGGFNLAGGSVGGDLGFDGTLFQQGSNGETLFQVTAESSSGARQIRIHDDSGTPKFTANEKGNVTIAGNIEVEETASTANQSDGIQGYLKIDTPSGAMRIPFYKPSDTTPPGDATLNNAAPVEERIEVYGNAPSDSDVERVEIQRSNTGSGGPFNPKGEVAVSTGDSFTYNDHSTTPGQTYHYRAKAVDNAGNRSENYSSVVSATAPGD